MDLEREVIAILGRVLNLGPRVAAFGPQTPLLGSVPELDSMAVAAIITTIEERFGFTIDDDEIDGSTFETVGTLVAFTKAKQAAA